MRILVLTSDAHGGFGGVAQYNRDIIDALVTDGFANNVVVLPRMINDPDFAAPRNTRYVRQASRGATSFLFRSMLEATRLGAYDLVYCAHINLLPLAATISGVVRSRLVLAIYGTDAWEQPKGRLILPSLSRVDLVISISQVTLDRFSGWIPPLRAKQAILPNAIRAESYGLGPKSPQLVQKYGLAGRRVIMTLGRMDPRERAKGFDEIIDVMPRLAQHSPDVIYLCSGDGGDKERLQAKAKANRVEDRVVFPGRIPEHEKADYFRLADAYVMPSRWEGFGFVVLEALACGIPVVASTADGTREAVMDGKLGLLADPSDPEGLERAILAALRRPKSVPDGLEYFSFSRFKERLQSALSGLVVPRERQLQADASQ